MRRFWRRVDVPDPDGCWVWTGGRNQYGYGAFYLGGKMRAVHRVAYEWLVGPIPAGLVLDHLCNERRCVNPAHLLPSTQRNNVRRAMARMGACRRGHPFTEENTLVYAAPGRSPARFCRECRREREKKRKER